MIRILTLAVLLAAAPVFAQPPNEGPLVKTLYDTGLYNLKSHDGLGAFVDVVVSTLHAKDANWRHLKKKPGQAQLHGHGEDSMIYLLPNNKAQAIDFVGGAGGSNPQPGWIVDSNGPIYTHADGHEPDNHGLGAAPPPVQPVYPPYPFPETAVDGAGTALFADFAEAGQSPNPEMFRFAFRVAYDWLTKTVPSLDASIAKHRKEWRALLGLPPLR